MYQMYHRVSSDHTTWTTHTTNMDRIKILWTHLLDGVDSLSKGDIERVVSASLDVEDLSDELSEVCEKLREEIKTARFDVSTLKSDHEFVIKVESEMKRKMESDRLKAEEEARLAKEASAPMLRGKMKRKESGQIAVEGKWAFSVQAFKEGKTNRFRLMSKNEDLVEKDNADGFFVKLGKHEFFGMFLLGEGEEMRKIKETVEIEFKKGETSGTYEVVGTGENEFGKFDLSGFYNAAKRKTVLKKMYQEQAEEDGDFDEEEDSDEEADYVDRGDVHDDEGTMMDDGVELDKSEMADELAALKAEQEMSVEELRRKYGGGGGGMEQEEKKKEKVEKKEKIQEEKKEEVPIKKKKKKKIIIKKIIKKVIKVKRKKKRKNPESSAEESTEKKAKVEQPPPQ